MGHIKSTLQLVPTFLSKLRDHESCAVMHSTLRHTLLLISHMLPSNPIMNKGTPIGIKFLDIPGRKNSCLKLSVNRLLSRQ